MPADSHIAVPDAGTGEMTQPLFHAGSRFTFPEIVILNSDGRNGDLSDGTVGEQKILCQLCESGRRRSSCGAALQKTGDLHSAADAKAAKYGEAFIKHIAKWVREHSEEE